MASAEPAFLPLGTEVSAKYRGAFCEAKVKKIVKQLKIKVQYQDGGSAVVSHEVVTGPLKTGCTVEVKFEEGESRTATISKITDQSQYTVVFDDGDENTLRRTQLCLKSEKHFLKYDTLDDLPLTHPEHFGTPVLKGKSKKRRAATSPHSSDSESESESDEPAPRQYPGRLVEMVGKLLLMTQEDRKKTMVVPVLVVQPNADSTDLRTRDHLLVKSFKDSKFYAITKKECKEFTRDAALKNDDKTLKPVYEKALLYFDAKELPPHWDKDDLFGSDSEEDDDDDVSSDDEQSEEKDMFVAQLYKFMDERGTPINKAPLIGSRDLSLYRLFRIVHKLGGYNRVTNQMKWRLVYSKMGLPNIATAANQIKTAYKRFLHAFEDFYRKLGSTMGTNITRPSRSRHSSGRTIPGFRDRDRPDSVSPKSPRSVTGSAKKEAKKEAKEDTSEEEKKEPSGKSTTSSPDSKSSRKSTGDISEENISPSKRKTRGGVEEKACKPALPKESKKPASVKSTAESDTSEKEEIKKKKPFKKKVTKQEEEEDKDETETESNKSETESTSGGKLTTPSSREIPETLYPYGSRLRVRYGKGKTQQVFHAKVIDAKCEQGVTQWLVHYEGWNNRYDEWIKKDRVVEAVRIAETKSGEPAKKPTTLTLNKTTPGQTKPPTGQAKTPGGQAKTPVGQAKTPIGQARTPVGQAKTPVGQTKMPLGQAKTAAGQAKTPVSQTKTLLGQAKTPVGQAKTPIGQTKPPLAQAKTPVGQAKALVSQAKSLVSKAKSPANQAKTPVNQAKTPPTLAKTPASLAKTPASLAKTPGNQTKTHAAQAKPVGQTKSPGPVARIPASQAKQTVKPTTTAVRSKGTPLVKKKSQTKIVTKSQKDEKSQKVGVKKSKAPRPTRSTSIESSLSTGLSPRKRPRRNSGYTEVSGQGDSSSDSEVTEDEEDDENESSGEKTPPHASPKSHKDDQMDTKSIDDSKLPLPKEASEYDIIKELEEFDKASQDSLERELNLDEDAMSGLGKNESEEGLDIKSLLSCLTKDEDKVQSSENESVVSMDTDRRTGRGRSKTKSMENFKTKLDTTVAKVKTDTVKAKSESEPETESAPTKGRPASGKAKADTVKTRTETQRAKVEPKTKGAAKAKMEAAKSKEESAKPKLGSPKSKAESSNTGVSSPKAKLLSPKVPVGSPKSKLVSPKSIASPKAEDSIKTTASSPKVEQTVKVELERLKPVETVVITEGSEDEESTPETNKLTKDIQLESFDLSQVEGIDDQKSDSTAQKDDVAELNEVKKEEVIEKSKDESDEDNNEQSDKYQSESSNDEQSPKEKEKEKTAKTGVKKVLKGRGRWKRKVQKEENADSEEEPMRKKTRRKTAPKKESESSKTSDPSNDEANPDEKTAEDMEWLNAPELSASPKLEEVVKEDSSTEDTAPPLSPVDEPQKEDRTENLNTFDLRGAMQSPAKATSASLPQHSEKVKPSISSTVEDTPPSTPEFVEHDRPSPPKVEPNSEAASTKSELEANMEVESYLQGALPPGRESPAVCENSNMSTPSDESNEPNTKTAESPVQPSPPLAQKKKPDECVAPSSAGRKRKRKTGHVHHHHHHKKHDSKPAIASDEDDAKEIGIGRAALSDHHKYPRGPSKYNFIQQLEEGKYLEGEERVNFLLTKIADLRSIYMQLKQEVASIDRRRKRYRKKQRLAAQGLIGLESALS